MDMVGSADERMNGWTEVRSGLEEERSDGRRPDIAESTRPFALALRR